MELTYGLHLPPQDTEFKENYEAFNTLMGTFELSGVFSEKLLDKVYVLALRALDVKIKKSKKEIEAKEADELRKKIYVEFHTLLNTYNIFSQEFKKTSLGLFHTLSYY